MKDAKLNKFDANQRRVLQAGVILILVLFLGIYFFQQWKDKSPSVNNKVYLEDDQLHIFNEVYTYNGYPDKILLHYPYLLFVQGNQSLTTIYNLETKKKEKGINEILLDYYDGNIVYNKKETFFNDKSLGEFCDSSFIKSSDEVLCITKQSKNFVDNMLISINPESPNLWKRVYQSENLITSVSVIDNDVYIGEIDFKTKKNFLTINEETMPVDNIVSIIYPLDGVPHFASFKSELNNYQNSYYPINTMIKGETSKIVFYE